MGIWNDCDLYPNRLPDVSSGRVVPSVALVVGCDIQALNQSMEISASPSDSTCIFPLYPPSIHRSRILSRRLHQNNIPVKPSRAALFAGLQFNTCSSHKDDWSYSSMSYQNPTHFQTAAFEWLVLWNLVAESHLTPCSSIQSRPQLFDAGRLRPG